MGDGAQGPPAREVLNSVATLRAVGLASARQRHCFGSAPGALHLFSLSQELDRRCSAELAALQWSLVACSCSPSQATWLAQWLRGGRALFALRISWGARPSSLRIACLQARRRNPLTHRRGVVLLGRFLAK